MFDEYIEDIYLTMRGQLKPEYKIPGIKNQFTPGSPCDQLHQQAYDARLRLEKRLGGKECDEDVETIINSMLSIQRLLCMEMFRIGFCCSHLRLEPLRFD